MKGMEDKLHKICIMLMRKKSANFLGAFMFFLFLMPAIAVSQEVKASIDTASIRIGEQIIYKLQVESTSEELVVFPEGQSFGSLEMVESFAVDTNKIQDRMRLIKEYALTQFDSGTYTIPQQRLIIAQRSILTDSFSVVVHDVEVDTTKQKMFPIKPSVEVPAGFAVADWVWWLIIGILLLLLVGFLLFRRKKRKDAAANKLPPYEQALFELRQLDDAHLLEQREIKEYYSQLSAAVRRYLDEEIYDHAMESTTSELIAYLEAQRAGGKLKLEDKTILRLRQILERADLAKFANSRPDVITAKEDRSSVEHVINDTKASIPQPTEEELLRDQEYRRKIEKKKKIRKIILGVAVLVLLIGGATAYVISTKGLDYFADTFIGNNSKELLEGEWIRSEYGNPPITITTPDVLVRELTDSTATTSGKEMFNLGGLNRNLFVSASTRPAGEGFKLEAAVEEVYTYLEKQGARNIITKEEKITTLNGAEGLRIYGTMALGQEGSEKLLAKEYAILNFAMGEGYQQIVIIYNEGDSYAEEIAQRITNSVELINKGS